MRVSIIILSYNYEAFVGTAIRSALQQIDADVEVIVVDDGSTDGSREVIERWGDRITRVFKENGGQASAYNAGFERATGDIVIFLDSDDSLEPDACAKIRSVFERDDAVVKVHFPMRLVDENDRPLGPIVPAQLDEGHLDKQLRKHGMLYASSPGSGNAYRRRALARLMPIAIDQSDPQGADFFIVYGISLLGKIRALRGKPLCNYRMHSTARRAEVTFGNAQQQNEPHASAARYPRMRRWLVERLGPDHRLEMPAMAPNFSLEKVGYALALFNSSGYVERLRIGAQYLSERLMPAIRNRPGSTVERVALAGWALSVLVLPRKLGLPVTRYVCNPSSR